MEKIRLGIVGTGSIVRRVMTDMGNCERITIAAIASRDYGRARAAADKYGAEYAYGSCLEMAQSDKVDLVYIATPNHCHLEQACLMMDYGKHVICEKPIAMNDDEARKMAECARENGVFLMEAMWTRFLPAVRKMRELVLEGAIGEVKHIFGSFCFYNDFDPDSRLYRPDMGGGALLDIGVYPLMGATLFMGCRPVGIQSRCEKAPSGVDSHTSLTLSFTGGRTAQIYTSIDTGSTNELILFGSKGTIHAPDFWRCTGFTVERTGCDIEKYTFAPEHEGHHYEFDHAAECIMAGLTESPVLTLDESVAVSGITTIARQSNGIFFPGEE